MDSLHEEFIEYQLLDKSILTEHQWNEAIVSVSGADDETPEKKYTIEWIQYGDLFLRELILHLDLNTYPW